MDGVSVRQSPALELVTVTDLKTSKQAGVCVDANDLSAWEEKDLPLAGSTRTHRANQWILSSKRAQILTLWSREKGGRFSC